MSIAIPGDDVVEADFCRTVADQLGVRNTLAWIAQYSDEGSLDSYGALFTAAARWEMPGAPILSGRAEIVAAGARRRAAGVTGPGSHSRHVLSTIAVTVDADQAVAESYWQFYTGTDTAPTLRSMGRYRDTFERDALGSWRVGHRLIALG